MKIKHGILALMAVGLFNVSCNNDDDENNIPLGAYDNGILVVNEGPFLDGTGTISFISEDLETNESAIYNKVNNADLGNVAQSMQLIGDEAYIVANVSNKIEVVNRYSFEHVATIDTGLENPRFLVEANGKGYVSNWGDTSDETDDYLAIINLTTNQVEGTIPVALGPERMLVKDGVIYVAHKGAWGTNNIISVINTSTQEVSTTITVGDRPDSLQMDDSDNLWVLSKGEPAWTGAETAGQLDIINVSTNEVSSTLEFGSTEHPSYLSIEGDDLYYNLGQDVYTLTTAATSLPSTSILTHTAAGFYGMDVNNGRLYVSDAGDFASNGTLSIYDLSTTKLVKDLTVGRNPNGVYFNE